MNSPVVEFENSGDSMQQWISGARQIKRGGKGDRLLSEAHIPPRLDLFLTVERVPARNVLKTSSPVSSIDGGSLSIDIF
jgi:hypothetical protein